MFVKFFLPFKKTQREVDMSKKISQLLLLAGLAASSFVGAAAHGSYSTVFNSDAHRYSMLSCKGMGSADEEASSSSLSLRLIYSRTWDSKAFGQYFLGNSATDNTQKIDNDIAGGNISADYLARVATSGAVGTWPDGTITLSPLQTRMAVAVSYAQNLQSILEGAWFDLNVSFARVENNLRATFTGATANTTSYGAAEFFGGATMVPGDGLTSTLAYGKMANNKANASATGLEQVDARLGYNFVSNDNGTFGGFVSGVMGLGTEPKCVELFESVVGHRHMMLGAGLQGDVSLSQTDEHSMSLKLEGKAHYIFSREDLRPANIVNVTVNGTNTNYQQYYLTKDGSLSWGPALNYITRKVTVKPRYSADLNATFVYSNDCTSFDLGYGLQYRAKEDNALVGTFDDSRYVIAGITAASNVPVAAVGTSTAAYINKANLDFNQPSKILHTVRGGVNYTFNDMANPMGVGFGGAIQIANNKNEAHQEWQVFAKLEVSF
jgi:hypothetical protein